MKRRVRVPNGMEVMTSGVSPMAVCQIQYCRRVNPGFAFAPRSRECSISGKPPIVHLYGSGFARPGNLFFQHVDAIIGPDEAIVYPEHLTEELDYELELAVVMKKSGKHFSAEQAGEYIGGYVIFNDITARDIQRMEMKSGVFSFCKGIDTFCPLGPHIVTADEIPNANNLAMELRVNGKTRQQSHSSKMSVTVPEIIAHHSPMGYSAGDVLSTGTVSGVAAFSGDLKSLYLKPGDVVECEIEKIGVLRNPVVSYREKHGGKSVAAA